MSQEVQDKLLCEITNVFTYYDTRISNLEKELEKHRNEISSLESKCTDLINKNNEVKEELASFSKVSIIKSLNKTLLEKEGEIKFLESKLKNTKPLKDESPKLLKEVKMIGDEPEAAVAEEEVAEAVVAEEEVAEAVVAEEEVAEEEVAEVAEAEVAEVAEEEVAEEEVAEEEVAEEEVVEAVAVTDTEDEEVEVEFTIKKLRGKEYYVTDDDDREIYEKLEDDEVGELVGKYNEKGRPTFFKKK